jgi:EpsI family protein
MSAAALRWAPAAVLALGALVTLGIDTQRAVPLRAPLGASVPARLAGYEGKDIQISEQEQQVAGMSSYVMRAYHPLGAAAGAAGFSLYVGYYESQTQGKTIHSPKNCLPGAGWEALTSSTTPIATAAGTVEVNRYLLQNGQQRALVLYWYQGRGRVEANEYKVKLDLLRDAALRGRSDEALVRVIVPVTSSEEEAYQLARRVASVLVPAVYTGIPT